MIPPFDALEADFFCDLAKDTHGLWEVFETVRGHYAKLSDEQVFERGRDYITRWIDFGWIRISDTPLFIHPRSRVCSRPLNFCGNVAWPLHATWRIHRPLNPRKKCCVFMRAKPFNQSLQPTALWRCASMLILISVLLVGAQPRYRSGG